MQSLIKLSYLDCQCATSGRKKHRTKIKIHGITRNYKTTNKTWRPVVINAASYTNTINCTYSLLSIISNALDVILKARLKY